MPAARAVHTAQALVRQLADGIHFHPYCEKSFVLCPKIQMSKQGQWLATNIE